jgi:hypothetical protein
MSLHLSDDKDKAAGYHPVMSKSKQPLTGGCQCGAIRYALHSKPINSHVCHCRMCQRAVGNLFASLVGCAKDRLEWTRGTPTFFASSSLAKRGFCANCGTPLSFSYNDETAHFYVTTGSLDDPGAAPVIMQYGTESRIHWVDFCEDVPGETTAQDADSRAALSSMVSNQS